MQSIMKMNIWVIQSLVLIECYLILASEVGVVEEKEEATKPITTMSPPPEGNTRFVDDGSGTTWCVALPGVSQSDLQNALDWACGLGMTDCHAIEDGGPCFEPDTLVSHASFAFNTYYHHNANSDIACNFGGTATLTKRNPSYGKCVYVHLDQWSLQHRHQRSTFPILFGGNFLGFYYFCIVFGKIISCLISFWSSMWKTKKKAGEGDYDVVIFVFAFGLGIKLHVL